MAESVEVGGRLGHYVLLEKIGAGGMGEVYRARDTKLERSVAIKILPALAAGDRNAVERLVREARLASSLNHPGIVTIHGIEDSGDLPYLVMELVPGETLRARLRRGPLELPELVSIGAQVADALDAAHRVGLIHRDIKASNILVTPDGRAKVADFGLAKRLPAPSDDAEVTAAVSLTATGAVVGTAAYMSPEQTRGEALDARTDVFSLGVVLYEAATGRLPFEGPTVLSVLHEIALVEPPAPSRARPGLPRELDQILRRAMAKDKIRRYAAAGELGAALRALLKGPASDTEEETAILGATPEGGVEAPANAPANAPARAPAPAGAPSPAAASPPIPNNLPVSLTSFVGRQEEMEEIGMLLASSRLVTLTGAGGCGKSRLGTQVARNVLEGYPDGVWLVELAPLTDSSLVVSRAAQTLGIRESAGRPVLEILCEAMAGRSFLLLLDNCEHVTASCASLAAALIAACPAGRVLATSRETLGVPGEVIVRVRPLEVPDVRDPKLGRREIGRFESVRLFAERAASVIPSFTLTDQNARVAAQICARLDGIPLAIELAAARVKVLPIGQILSRLEDRFRLLTAGSPGALPHQQTLRAAVDWSYDLLDEAERNLFNRLSVFAGGASLEAVEAVASGAGIACDAILDLLTHLVDKSLVTPEEGAGGTARYRLLETLREYGKEKLTEAGARSRILERHASHFVGLAEEASRELTGPEQSRWLEALEEDHDNLRAAMDWGLEEGQVTGVATRSIALRLAAALWRFWLVRGHFSEGRRRLAAALSGEDVERDNARVRAKALRGAAVLARAQSDYERARALIEESLALERPENDRAGIAESLQELGNIADGQGDHAQARAHYEESLAIRRESGDRRGMAGLLHNLGVVTQAQGDLERARALYTESLSINRELGNEAWEAAALNALASIALEQGDYAAARHHQERSLAIHRRLRDKWGIAYTLHELGRVATRTGDLQNARRMLEDALRLFRDLGDSVGLAETLEYFAALAAEERRDEVALLLAGAAAALREALGTPATSTDLAGLDAHLAGARERLGKEAAEAILARGRSRNAEEAIAEVIDIT